MYAVFRQCHADAVTNRIQESPEFGDTSVVSGNFTAFTSQQFLLLREHLNISGNVGFHHAYMSCCVVMMEIKIYLVLYQWVLGSSFGPPASSSGPNWVQWSYCCFDQNVLIYVCNCVNIYNIIYYIIL